LTRFIERYLDKKMQPSELRWFEKELDGNLWLQEELELRRKTNEFIKNAGALEFRKKLIEAEGRQRSRTPIQKVVTSKPMYYAAAILGVIVISGVLLIKGLNTDPQQLINGYTVVSSVSAMRSAEAVPDGFYKKAIEFYNEKDFKNAALWFEKIVDNNEKVDKVDIEADFRLGVSSMKTEMHQKAIKSFNRVVEHNDNLYIEDAEWYRGLCYYHINETEKAKTIFEGIAASDSRFRKSAKKLARKI